MHAQHFIQCFLLCRVIAPIEGVVLIIWWMVTEILDNGDTWWQITSDSLAVTLSEWAFVLLVAIGLNWWLKPLVIHPPENPTKRKILGFFFKLTPIPNLNDPESKSPPPDYTPQVDVRTALCVCVCVCDKYSACNVL